MNDKVLDEAAEKSFRRFMLVSECVSGINLEEQIRETSLCQKEAQAIIEIIKITYMTGFKTGYISAN